MKKIFSLLFIFMVSACGWQLTSAQTTAIKPPKPVRPVKPTKPNKPSKPSDFSTNTNPLTQYFIVEVVNYGVHFRNTTDLTRMLKSLGFRTQTNFGRNSNEWFRASRNGTTVQFKYNGEESYCIIKFRNQQELDEFIDSMFRSHWVFDGRIYSHPDNDSGKVYAKVNGLTVTLIEPFEMLPYNF